MTDLPIASNLPIETWNALAKRVTDLREQRDKALARVSELQAQIDLLESLARGEDS